jgi:hypothetical protein
MKARRMSDFNYPPQTGAYKVVVKSGAAWRDYDTARLEISVGQPYHEGAKFEATVDWVKHRFSHVIVSVNDILQRFNLMFERGLSESRAMSVARHAGSEWIRQQRPVLLRLPGYELCRWNEWLSHPGFSAALEQTGTFTSNIKASGMPYVPISVRSGAVNYALPLLIRKRIFRVFLICPNSISSKKPLFFH